MQEPSTQGLRCDCTQSQRRGGKQTAPLTCGFKGSPQHFNLFERWSVYHEVSHTNVLYGQTEVRDVGSLLAMHAPPAGSGWQRGDLMGSIGRHFNRASGSIFPHLARTGGIRPADRRRSRCALSLIEREEISRGLVTKQSLRSIAQNLNRSPSTISREVRRNGGRQAYRAAPSDQRAWDCAKRPKLCKLTFNDPLCQLIARKLRRKWSPQQIAGWLKHKYPDEEQKRVLHETIDRSLYVQIRGAMKKELQRCLRSPRAIWRSRHATQKGLELRKIKNAVSISKRSAEVEDRAVSGHHCRQGIHSMPERGEGDLISGSNNRYIATLVERHSRFVMLAKIANKDTQSMTTALIKQARKFPRELYKSLTWDRGTEMAGHQNFTIATNIGVYLCDPQSPLSSLQAAISG
jgi:IS30 family transposase